MREEQLEQTTTGRGETATTFKVEGREPPNRLN